MALLDTSKLVLLSGKGGVGKTTLSCALARQLAHAQPDSRILLISTDPAHSLGDVLGFEVGDQPVSLPDLGNLEIRALDAEKLLTAFKSLYGHALELIAERGSWFERDDLLPIWDLAWPGVDELMAILEVNRLLSKNVADTVILDTAPTGHTLRLLELPDFLDNILGVFSTFQAKHREISETLTGSYRGDEADDFLAQLQAELQGGRARLMDTQSTAAWLVMIPEQLSIDETGRFCTALQKRQVPIGGILVNQVLDFAAEAGSLTQVRQQHQAELLTILAKNLQAYSIWISGFQLQEPIGGAALDQVADALVPLTDFLAKHLQSPAQVPVAEAGIPTHLSDAHLPDPLTQGIRLALTGGKGGVGKTTVAGSLAWGLAKAHPDRNILVVSIDPAHSLGDLFLTPLAQDPVALLPNLWGQEIDANTVMEQFKRDYLDDIVAILGGESAGIEVQYDPQAWQRMFEMPPPGLDEVMALLTVLEQMELGQFDLVVLDTAPTGHLLRFLQMPEALEGWVKLALKLWLKYRDRVGRPELAQRLRGLLKQVRELREQLTDPSFITFIPVFNPEKAVLAETERLVLALDELGIPHPYAVLNRVWVTSQDAFGQAVSERHRQILGSLAEHLPNQAVIEIPFLADPTLEAMGSYLLGTPS